MDVQGEYRFNAPRAVVYRMLLDPALIEPSLPGCERFQPAGPDAYDVHLRVGIAALKGSYAGRVHIVDKREPASFRLETAGKGGSGGVTGTATITLTDAGAGTLLTYRGEMKAQGGLASLGMNMLGGSAKLLIGQFLKSMDKEIRSRTI